MPLRVNTDPAPESFPLFFVVRDSSAPLRLCVFALTGLDRHSVYSVFAKRSVHSVFPLDNCILIAYIELDI